MSLTTATKDASAPPLKVLLVENHEDTLLYLTRHLEEGGHIVVPAHSVAEAMDAISHKIVDVLLCDIHLPDGSGWDIPAAIAAERRPPLCIAISGYVRRLEMQRSYDAGFHHHLIKPFLPSQLDALLTRGTRPAEPAGPIPQ